MKSLFWVLALFALAVGISLSARINDAYILFVLPPYRAEISLIPAILLGAVGFVALYTLLRVIALALSLPRKMRELHLRRKHKKAAETFGKAVRLYLEGETRKVIIATEKLRDAEEWSELAVLLAERVASETAEATQERLPAVIEAEAPSVQEEDAARI
jgi:HemY protein